MPMHEGFLHDNIIIIVPKINNFIQLKRTYTQILRIEENNASIFVHKFQKKIIGRLNSRHICFCSGNNRCCIHKNN